MREGEHSLLVRQKGYQEYCSNFSVKDKSVEIKVPPLIEIANVKVSLTDSHAEIDIDGIFYGSNGWSGELPVGQHILNVRLIDHEDYCQQIDVRPSSDNIFEVPALKRLHGVSFTYENTDENAELFINGKSAGLYINRADNVKLPVGSHKLVVKKDCRHEDYIDILTINESDSQQIIVQIPRLKLKEYVDLGLPSGTLWATSNLGAADESDSGWEFGWGQINPMDEDSSLKKRYKTNSKIAKKILKTTKSISGNPVYDVATAIKGKGWRIPTADDVKELLEYCIFKQITLPNDKKAYMVIGPSGACIIIPARLYRVGVELWTGDEEKYSQKKAPRLRTLYLSDSNKMLSSTGCEFWLPIRPVRDKE